MSAQIQYGPVVPPTPVETPHAYPPDGECRFVTPVRFGRRKTDQVGQLLFTDLWLTFRGSMDLSVSWTEVARVDHTDSHLMVTLHGTRRTLVFCCPSSEEASQGSLIATHLASLAHAEPT